MTETCYIEISNDEVVALYAILQRIAGDPNKSMRGPCNKLFRTVKSQIEGKGLARSANRVDESTTGCITFHRLPHKDPAVERARVQAKDVALGEWIYFPQNYDSIPLMRIEPILGDSPQFVSEDGLVHAFLPRVTVYLRKVLDNSETDPNDLKDL